MRKVLCLFFLLCLLFLFSRTGRGFTIARIASDISAACDVSQPLSEKERRELLEAFSEPLHYLGSGTQCYAFSSTSGQYVLKFFKMKHLLPKRWLPILPLSFWKKHRFKEIEQKQINREELFTSYKIAYEHFRQESALVALHLSKTCDWHLPVTLIDKRGKAHCINLDDFEFVVQKKAERLGDYLDTLLEKQERKQAFALIRSLLAQILLQCKKGFVDNDSGIFSNYGVIHGEVVHFDSGRFKAEPEACSALFCKGMLERARQRIAVRLKEKDPELLGEVEELVRRMSDGCGEE